MSIDINEPLTGTQVRVEARFVSELHSYGTKVPRSRKERAKSSRAVIAALRTQKEEDQNPTPSSKKKTSKSKHPHRQYGTHQGNKHVFDIHVGVYPSSDEIPDHIRIGIANTMTILESSVTSIDIKAKKNECEAKDAALDSEFERMYGTTLTDDLSARLRVQKAKNSFTYWSTEITLTVTTCYSFKGSRPNGDGTFTTVVRSKRIYTDNLIPLSWVVANISLREDVTEFIKGTVTSYDAQKMFYLPHPDTGKPRFVSEKSRARYLARGYS